MWTGFINFYTHGKVHFQRADAEATRYALLDAAIFSIASVE